MNGILLVDKPSDISSFKIVSVLRKRLNIKKIGHAGTLDPFATGLMVMLVGREFTKLSDLFLNHDKEYIGTLKLGHSTTTFDTEGEIKDSSDYIPTREEVETVLSQFQGEIDQTPPMFSAKKVGGKKLYELARKGIEIERKSVKVKVQITLLDYSYPNMTIQVSCSKGTYIRSLANDIGIELKSFAHLIQLKRIRSGPFHLNGAIPYALITETEEPLTHGYHQINQELSLTK